MGHRYAVIGVGRMGRAIAWWLCGRKDTELVRLIDRSSGGIAEFKRRFQGVGDCPKAIYHVNDDSSEDELIDMVRDVDVAILACGYQHHLEWTLRCIRAGTHVVDLGGNRDVVHEQQRLHGSAKLEGLTVIPDLGVAPGLASLLGMDMFYTLETDHQCMEDTISINMMVGGLPLDPGDDNPLHYLLNWSASGLINEYVEPVEMVKDGKLVREDPLRGWTEIGYADVIFGPELPHVLLEAFTTSGGAGNLPEMMQRCVNSVGYKTIRHRGHHEVLMILKRLGMFDRGYYIPNGSTPRHALEFLIDRNLKNESDEDLILLHVEAMGNHRAPDGRLIVMTNKLVVRRDKETGFSAMAQATSFPTAAVAEQLADGTIKDRGVVNGEEVVVVHDLLKRISEHGGLNVSGHCSE